MNQKPWMPILISVLTSAAGGLGGVAFGMLFLQTYGWILFLGVPFGVALVASMILRQFRPVGFAACFGVSLLSLTLLMALILLFAIDGLLCILMAAPLALVLALPGTAIGYFLGKRLAAKAARIVPLFVILSLPLFMAFEKVYEKPPTIHTVISSVVIDAPIESVWREVIAFDRITAPPDGIFRFGIAYPIEAKIEGQGVGAVRHCIFSTGPFIEPITRWDPPYALEFSVISNPIPMQEWSPWPHVAAPHLHGTFESQKGQFRLREENGKTVLEGTTWYHQRILPDWYWSRISDRIIHRIHFRVLNHIKACAESGDVTSIQVSTTQN